MSPVIEIDHLTKYYGQRKAVDDVNLSVDANEVLGLLGPNGSGKTTILRVLTGYLRPTSGIVRIAGLDVSRESLAARRRVGYVPEDVPLYPTMEVEEFLRFMGSLKGLRRRALAAAVSRSIERLSLGGVRRLLIAKLSRGYRQRVAIGQALLSDPALLVLDEPTNGLDPRQIIEVREMIRELAQSHTVLITSHILGEIEKVANRVAILLNGRLLALESLASRHDRRVRMRVAAASIGSIEACLATVEGTTLAEREAGTGTDPVHTIFIDVDSSTRVPGVVAALVRANLGVIEVGPAASDLETRFLQLTGLAPVQ